MFKSLFGLVEDVAKIAIAPVQVVANVARVVTKPVAEVLEDLVEASDDLTED